MTTTPVAVLGPLFLPTRAYQKGLFCWNGGFISQSSGNAYFVIWGSAVPVFGATICVLAEAELFAVFGSVSLALTVAVLVMVPVAVGALTTMVIVALAPFASGPMLHVTVPEAWVQVPWVELAETNVTPAGRESVTTTPDAPSGPLFVAVTVYVIGVVAVAVAGAVLVMDMSAFSGA